jgi:hypothetical protein
VQADRVPHRCGDTSSGTLSIRQRFGPIDIDVPSVSARRSSDGVELRIRDLLPDLKAFRAYLPADRIRETGPMSASEDFGSFGVQWQAPSVFWFVGGTDPDVYERAKAAGRVSKLPTNHNPRCAPVLLPTLETGITTLVVASRAWLASETDR